MKQQGFSLIELLVVIGIITIIVGIATASFRTASATMRDGKRKADIDTIALVLESSKNYANKTYNYDLSTYQNDFPQGLPQDPTPGKFYCMKRNADIYGLYMDPQYLLTINHTTGCPSGGTGFIQTFYYIVSSGSLKGIKSWILCASMEREPLPYCRTSLLR